MGAPSNGYGLTETSSVTTMNSGDDYVHAARTASAPPSRCATSRVVPDGFAGDEPGADLPAGPDVTGELWIKGPNVVRGYWNKPEATAATFTRGWLHSGDVARIDEDGFVYIVDRAKDMVIRGGENVYSVEVEAALFEHPGRGRRRRDRRAPPRARRGGGRGGGAATREQGHRRGAQPATSASAWRGSRCRPTSGSASEPLPRNPQGKVLKRELRDDLVGPRRRPRAAERRRACMGLLAGRRAVVTGGASGIGRAACRRLAAEGARRGRARHRRGRGGRRGAGGRRDGVRRRRHRRRGAARGRGRGRRAPSGDCRSSSTTRAGRTMAPLAALGPRRSGTASSG